MRGLRFNIPKRFVKYTKNLIYCTYDFPQQRLLSTIIEVRLNKDCRISAISSLPQSNFALKFEDVQTKEKSTARSIRFTLT
ncbi:unnamed protein product [Callosobruchus maculatus]|uniref:Uncharacterized protein n=1 Tax=Callosobruchus maculatus TaxID=64391 RepID=A0A653DFJ0_CALMS|nr:unnamed protein product [Callosobruchus maculatus]